MIHEASQITVSDCLDDLIKNHYLEIESRLTAEHFLWDLVSDFLSEIVQESIELQCFGEELMSILEEVIKQEVEVVVKEALTDYGARYAFSQYKQISQVVIFCSNLEILLAYLGSCTTM